MRPTKFDDGVGIVGRWGEPPHVIGISVSGANCPDILETTEGSFVVIGHDLGRPPLAAGDLRAVLVPRRTAESARRKPCAAGSR